jgi:hypothetical protein
MLWMRDPFGRPQSHDKSESRRTTDLPQRVRQLASEVQGQATTAGAQGALSARQHKHGLSHGLRP